MQGTVRWVMGEMRDKEEEDKPEINIGRKSLNLWKKQRGQNSYQKWTISDKLSESWSHEMSRAPTTKAVEGPEEEGSISTSSGFLFKGKSN